jgi:hypothetical protein
MVEVEARVKVDLEPVEGEELEVVQANFRENLARFLSTEPNIIDGQIEIIGKDKKVLARAKFKRVDHEVKPSNP